MLNLVFLSEIRQQEVIFASSLIGNPTGRLLEIGAGTGEQARALSELGFDVEAIDVAGSLYESRRVFPVKIFDGNTIPFADNSFDVVFTSNVLPHISHLELFQKEILRVLKPKGIVLHILPTTGWRFWTFVIHYPSNLIKKSKYILSKLFASLPDSAPQEKGVDREHASAIESKHASSNFLDRTRRRLMWLFEPPRRLGERGSVFTEHYLFSEYCWRNRFQRDGWVISACVPNHLFYTGHLLFGARITLQARRTLSYVLGSACKIYILQLGNAQASIKTA